MGKKSGPSMPAAPNYTQLANQQQAANQQAANWQLQNSRVNQSTPYGSLTWSQGPGGWSANTTLSPEQQQLYSSIQQGSMNGPSASGLPEWQTGAPTSQFQGVNVPTSNPLANLPQLNQDYAQQAQQAQQANYEQQTRMLDPQFQQRETQLRAQLLNQGLAPGSQAYDQAINNFELEKQNAYNQARQGSIAAGNAQSASLNQQANQAYNSLFNSQLAAQNQGFGQQLSAAELANQNAQGLFGQQQANANLANAVRQAGFGQNLQAWQAPLAQQQSLFGLTQPQFQNYAAPGYTPGNFYGAGQDQYQAAINRYNAQQAAAANNPLSFQNLLGTAGTVFGTAFGGPLGASLGNAAGKWAGGLFGGGGGQPAGGLQPNSSWVG